ncbi:hypothetical protein ACFQ0K_19390 [Nocardioides caeni]|uniref:Uncharacterized protein n=1 Tax=Nocardioides caeni TaxID=574700 RepID=A0A4S8NFZ3_9ACTN|nr:hypothetical protein [Nocardioides caeni]THV14792.1 hypothetical protein E9934_09100 [Nocardioides caeni]
MRPEWVAAWAAVATAVIYVGLGGLAALQIREMRKVRQLSSRPYVVVDFELRRSLVYVLITNIGQTPAIDVDIAWDKPLQTVGVLAEPKDASVFKAPIPMLAPGREIRVAYGISSKVLNEPGLPLRYTATVTYADSGPRPTRHSEPNVLDLELYRDAAVGPKGITELVEELERIRRAIAGGRPN